MLPLYPGRRTTVLKNWRVCFKVTKSVVICYKSQHKTVMCVHPEVDWKRKGETCYSGNHRQSQLGRRLWLVEACEGDWMEKVGSERDRPHKGGAGDRPRTLINTRTGKQWNWDLMKWGLSKVIRGLDAALKRLAGPSLLILFSLPFWSQVSLLVSPLGLLPQYAAWHKATDSLWAGAPKTVNQNQRARDAAQ